MLFARTLSSRLRRCLPGFILGAALLLPGCGNKAETRWIPDDAAVVRCTVSGPNLQLPPLVDELPTPMLPTGLLARTMDPIALDQLGYERERSVCATLQSPTETELELAAQNIDELAQLRRALSSSLRGMGRCRCAYAKAIDASALVPGCKDKPTDDSCEADNEHNAQLEEFLEPLRVKLAQTEVPRVHWRLVGRSDRLGRFVARREELVARHPGGSEVYVQGMPLPPRHGAKLLSSLLAMDSVVAVVSQDSGHALLVVREIGDLLILDHFGYADWGTRAHAEANALLPFMEDAQVERYRAALASPDAARTLQLKPSKGYLIEVDRAAIERVDRAAEISAKFVSRTYDPAQERRVLPPILADRLTLQVPFGTEGNALHARLRLTEEGQRWMSATAGLPMLEALETLGKVDLVPEFHAARGRADDLFYLRGQPLEQLLFAGPSALPKILSAVEDAAPGSVEGSVDDWKVALPSGPLPGDLPSRDGIRALRERLSLHPHTLEGTTEDGGRVLSLELSRR